MGRIFPAAGIAGILLCAHDGAASGDPANGVAGTP